MRVAAFCLGVGLVGAGLALGDSARADLGPPPSCPPGQTARYLYGHYCGPIECTDDGPCGAGKCEERALCLRDRGSNATEVVGACNAEGACTGGEGQCVKRKFCGATSAPAAPTAQGASPGPVLPAARGCSCDTTATGPSRSPWPLGLLGVGLALAGLRGRRRA